MHAWRVHEYGPWREQLRWEQCATPEPPEDGVVVRVRAAGVNFPDMLSIAGKYQVKAPLPFSPGLEAAGVVEKVGPRSKRTVGERVIAYGSWGAFAEYMAAPDAQTFPIPDELPDADAAAMHVIYQTSYFALDYRAHLQRGEVLLVHGGAGGVGTSAIQLGKHFGATVIATAGGADKLQVCRDQGADHVIDYRDEDFAAVVQEITGGRGADVIYDPVGGKVNHLSTKCIAFSGRLLIIGFASGSIPEIAANRILLKNISVVGVHWGAYQIHQPQLIVDTHERLCVLHRRGAIKPVIYRQLPMADLPAGLEALESRQSYGKIVLTNA